MWIFFILLFVSFASYHKSRFSFILKKIYSKTCFERPLKKKAKIGFQDQLSFNAGQKYCRMLQGEHSAILSTSIKLPLVIKICVLSTFKWPLKTGFTILIFLMSLCKTSR